jgi:hypothetical protein
MEFGLPRNTQDFFVKKLTVKITSYEKVKEILPQSTIFTVNYRRFSVFIGKPNCNNVYHTNIHHNFPIVSDNAQ